MIKARSFLKLMALAIALFFSGSTLLYLQGNMGGLPPIVFLGVMLIGLGFYTGRDAWKSFRYWLDEEPH